MASSSVCSASPVAILRMLLQLVAVQPWLTTTGPRKESLMLPESGQNEEDMGQIHIEKVILAVATSPILIAFLGPLSLASAR